MREELTIVFGILSCIAYTGGFILILTFGMWFMEKIFKIFPALDSFMDKIFDMSEEDWRGEL